mmetsp:Transcript_35525/g.93285  ORF Transcript_35525/g.93285 Transcript_35525/m.93285 type:complete len:83 (-) Transcript_35525:101-349(-)
MLTQFICPYSRRRKMFSKFCFVALKSPWPINNKVTCAERAGRISAITSKSNSSIDRGHVISLSNGRRNAERNQFSNCRRNAK